MIEAALQFNELWTKRPAEAMERQRTAIPVTLTRPVKARVQDWR